MPSEPQHHGPLHLTLTLRLEGGRFHEAALVINGERVIAAHNCFNGEAWDEGPLTQDEAALIVRAVNSLQSSIAAMEAALEHIGHTVPMSDNGRRERDEAMAQLRAAIKLAKGESNA